MAGTAELTPTGFHQQPKVVRRYLETRDQRRLGILSSGRPSPGRSHAISSLVHHARNTHHLKVLGVRNGFHGLSEKNWLTFRSATPNGPGDVATITRQDVHIDFRQTDARQRAYQNLQSGGIDFLIAVGGRGTLEGMRLFAREHTNLTCGFIPASWKADLGYTAGQLGLQSVLSASLGHLKYLNAGMVAEDRSQTMVLETPTPFTHWHDLELAKIAGRSLVQLALTPQHPVTWSDLRAFFQGDATHQGNIILGHDVNSIVDWPAVETPRESSFSATLADLLQTETERPHHNQIFPCDRNFWQTAPYDEFLAESFARALLTSMVSVPQNGYAVGLKPEGQIPADIETWTFTQLPTNLLDQRMSLLVDELLAARQLCRRTFK